MTPNTARAVAAGCLAAPFVALLWVPWYARSGPALGGVPFFYWYQLAWVPGSAALMFVAHLSLRHARATIRADDRPGDHRPASRRR